MFIEERHQEISDAIKVNGKITIAEITSKYGISDESARRDLRLLEQKGVCKRTHGGAISIQKISVRPPVDRDFEKMRDEKFDGMIITGAPVEQMEFEDVNYWDEITGIFDWARTHVTSTIYICWAAQAGLYYHYGIPKYPLPKKMFGVFRQHTLCPQLPIFRGFDDVFYMPHSRHTEVRKEDILANPDLTLIADSPENGVSMVMARGGREFFITGHMEYAFNTLDNEYKRDRGIRDDVDMPVNYYRDNNPDNKPLVTWRAHANLLYHNWINYYIYQETPYDITKIQ